MRVMRVNIILLVLLAVAAVFTVLKPIVSTLILAGAIAFVCYKTILKKSCVSEKEVLTNQDVDFITGLHNRFYYTNYIEQMISNKQEFTMYYVDLNNFKSINDVHGHDIGDEVLKKIGARFKALQSKDIVFARVGGDEFVIIYKTLNEDDINSFGKKIKDCLEEPCTISHSEFKVSASIGVSRFPEDSDNAQDLYKLADMAMYQAKKSGLDDYVVISKELTGTLAKRKKIASYLKNIDIEKDLILEYQPRFDFAEDKLVGVEALVRWNHESGIIMPDDFIHLAEEMDIVKEITMWTFVNALQQIKKWNEEYDKNLVVSLNVSNSCIHNRIWFENLEFMLDKFEINPEWLTVDITEVMLSISPMYMKKLLNSISELGVGVHLDDFGLGSFSVPSLKELKIDTIKIDNVFINGLNEQNTDIVKSMILLAHGLNIKAGAEAVESKEQYDILKAQGCDSLQGYYKEKPLSAKEFESKYLA